MSFGFSIFLIVVGAILKYAVTDNVANVDLAMVGVILMVAGVIGLVVSLYWMFSRRRTDVVYHDRVDSYPPV